MSAKNNNNEDNILQNLWKFVNSKNMMFVNIYKSGLKSSYDDIISAVDDIFDQWYPSTSTLMEEVYEAQEGRNVEK